GIAVQADEEIGDEVRQRGVAENSFAVVEPLESLEHLHEVWAASILDVFRGKKSVAPLGFEEGPNQGDDFYRIAKLGPARQGFLEVELISGGVLFEQGFREEGMPQSGVERVRPSLDDFCRLGD